MEEEQKPQKQMLGGNIELEGFQSIDGGSMVIVRKLVGSYTRAISDSISGFERISVSLKTGNGSYVITALLAAHGQQFKAEVTDVNLFFALDTVLKQLKSSAIP